MINVELPKKQPKDATVQVGCGLLGSTGGYSDGWLARIKLATGVYLQLFPKYGLVAMEVADNGNTNLPICNTTVAEMLNHLFAGEKPGKENPKSAGETTSRSVFAKDVDLPGGAEPIKRSQALAAITELIRVGKKMAAGWGLRAY